MGDNAITSFTWELPRMRDFLHNLTEGCQSTIHSTSDTSCEARGPLVAAAASRPQGACKREKKNSFFKKKFPKDVPFIVFISFHNFHLCNLMAKGTDLLLLTVFVLACALTNLLEINRTLTPSENRQSLH